MERLALFGSLFLTLIVATSGSMSSATVLARKGYSARLGAAAGWLLGMGGGLLTTLLALLLTQNGGITVLMSLVGSVGALMLLWDRVPDKVQLGNNLPQGDALKRNIEARHVRGSIMRLLFVSSIAVALITLAVLLGTIINKSVGLTAVQYQVEPDALLLNGEATGRAVEDLSDAELEQVLAENMRVARLRVFALERVVEAAQEDWATLSPMLVSEVFAGFDYDEALADVPFNELDEAQTASLLALNLGRDGTLDLLYDEVIQKEVAEAWLLLDSLMERAEIEATVTEEYPNADLQWRSWVNWEFISSPLDPRTPDATGIRPGLKGSLLVIAFTILFAFPVGVGAAIYLEEYAVDNRLNRIIQTNISNLAGVPSIIYGMLGLAIFVRFLEAFTSGRIFGFDTANGRTVISAGFTLALLILPLIIVNAQEAIRAVPNSLRQASYGLGATKWQTIWHHVLPYSMSGILTGTILAISRAIGETAPLILVGGATYLTHDPDGPFSIFTALPLLIYRWTTLPQAEFRNAAAAAIIVLLLLLLTMNSIAVILRNHFNGRLS